MSEKGSNPLPRNGLRLCIHKVENKEAFGEVYSPLFKEPLIFQSFTEMLLKVDSLFDQIGYPQAFEEKRTFTKRSVGTRSYAASPDIMQDVKKIEAYYGQQYTIEVRVESRRKANWQGNIFSILSGERQKKYVAHFSSEMELLKELMHLCEME